MIYIIGTLIYNILVLLYYTDIESEKKHNVLLERLDSYDKSALKPTETQEKIVLPTSEGTLKT